MNKIIEKSKYKIWFNLNKKSYENYLKYTFLEKIYAFIFLKYMANNKMRSFLFIFDLDNPKRKIKLSAWYKFLFKNKEIEFEDYILW